MRRALAALALVAACAAPPPPAPEPVFRDASVAVASKAALDPARLAGRWHGAAWFPDGFRAGCAGLTLDYAPLPGGAMSRSERCLGADGAPLRARGGVARPDGPGRLRLEGPDGAEPLWVLWTDEAYRVAVVAHPGGRGGAILARGLPLRADLGRAAATVLDFNGFRTMALTGPVESFSRAGSTP
ncbi:lipocalin family protein [Jannaschia sp. W003]|uniref:lipocalin family protein n=1 Tax=Jannaschia sp. W003 TaxID=2867012 RepID=UPI0021A45D3D|nr:lipocalin family protein [Jannaschia sp. W003]UWQ22907.1 lipocalin family protein [Jannaschia sp. W003]